MKRRKSLAILVALVFLFSALIPSQTFAASNTSVHLFLDGPAVSVTVYMSVDGTTVTGYPMTPQGGHWTSLDYSSDSTVTVQWFEIDGETYIWNPIEERDPEIVSGVEGTGTGTNKYTIELREPAMPSIDVEKNASPAVFNAVGDVITYTVTVENDGNVDMDTVALNDTLVASAGTPTGDSGSDSILSPDEIWTYTYTYSITQGDIDTGQVDNTATGSAYFDETEYTDSDSATVTTTQNPSIDVNKSALPTTYSTVGESITYTVTLNNNGNVSLGTVTLADSLVASAGTPAGDTGDDDILSPGETWTYTYTYNITQDDIDTGQVDNTATGSAYFDETEYTDSDSATVSTTQNPSIDVEKSASPTTYSSVGDVITYTVTVENDGNVNLGSVTLADSLVASPGTPVGDIGDDDILSPGETWTYTYTYTITQGDMDAGKVDNTATGSAYFGSAPVTDNDSATVTTTRNPSIDVNKSASPTTYSSVGDVITYTVTVDNDGNVNLGTVTLADSLVASAGTPAGDTGDDDILSPSETWTYTYTYTITQNDMDAGQVDNTATGSAYFDETEYTDSDSATVTTIQNPSIDVEKSASPSTYSAVGDVITYTVAVENDGNVNLGTVTLADSLVASAGTPDGDTGDDDILSPGETWTYTYTYTITQNDMDAGQVDNTATGSAYFDETEYTDNDNATVTTTQNPSIDVEKSASPSTYSAVGDVITYTVTVENDGNVSLGSVTLDDTLVDSLGSPAVDSGDDDILSPGEIWSYTYTYTITQDDIDNGQVDNVATGSAYFDETEYTDSDSATVNANQNPSIELTKAASPDTLAQIGDEITYTFTVENTGNVTLYGVYVSDPGLGFTSTPTITLVPGQSVTLTQTATYTILEADSFAGSYVNTATAYGYEMESEIPVTDNDTVRLPVAGPAPGILLDKEAVLTGAAEIGETVTYQFTVTNTGSVTLYDVGVIDPGLGFTSTQPITLASGQSITLSETASYTVTQADAFNGTYSNTATAYGWINEPQLQVYVLDQVTENTPDVMDSDTEVIDIEDAVWSVGINKTVSPGTVTVGQSATYTIVITNTGNVDLGWGNIVDEMLDIDYWWGEGGALEPGETITLTEPYTTSSGDVPSVTNTASVEAWTQREDRVYDQDDAVLNVNTIPVPVTYTVTYLPGLHGTLSGVTVTSGLPYGTTTPAAPTVNPEEGWTFTGWNPTRSPIVTGNATYTAQYSPEETYNPNISVTITPDADLVEAGTDVVFTMVVTNTGDTVLNNVNVVNTDLDFSTVIPMMPVLGSETFTVTMTMDEVGDFDYTVTAEGTSPQVVAVNDTDVTLVEVFETETPLNPPTGAIPFDAYAVSGLLAMGAGIFGLIKRKKEDEDEEDI